MDQVENETAAQQSTSPNLDQRIRKFTSSLKKDFAADIAEDPSGFRSRVIGKVRANLPRQRPGRKASPLILRAAEIYQELTAKGKKGRDGVWHLVALKACPEYATLPIDAQRLLRYTLRAAVHSVRHEAAARERRTSIK